MSREVGSYLLVSDWQLKENKMKWRFIRDYPNYLICEDGRVYNIKTNKLVNGFLNSQSYRRVCLSNKSGRRFFYVHRVVAANFCHNPNNHIEVHHKDHNRFNNHKSNLKWVSRQENMHYVHYRYLPYKNDREARPIESYTRVPRRLKKKLKRICINIY